MPGSAVEITAANSHDLLVRVVDGDARIESSWGSEAVAATQSAFVSGPTGRPFVSPWLASPHDAFHQWAGGRMVVLVPPAAFLPYAHPTYRQQQYARVLRSQRFERRRGGDFTRGDRPAGAHRRDSGRRGVQRDGDRRDGDWRGRERRGGDQTRRAERRDRENNSAPRTAPRPAPKPPTVTARGATAGKVVRPR
jgi:hypothetical protein